MSENTSLNFLKQIFILALFWVVSLSFGSLFVGLLAPLFGIWDLGAVMSNVQAGNDQHANSLRILLMISHAFTFLLPAIFFVQWYWRKPLGSTLYLNTTPTARDFGFSFGFILLLLPLVNCLYALNMLIPESWQQQDQGKLIKFLMQMDGLGELSLNLILIGLLAGVGEELLFRGILQRILAVRSQNIHLAIWTTAVIFSLIHFEMQGFLPRLALGAALGYVFTWSGSLWTSIILHTLFNASQVVALYIAPSMSEQKPNFEPNLLIAAAVSSGLLWWLLRVWNAQNSKNNLLSNHFFTQPS